MVVKMRKIIKIDRDKCNGCGICVPSCAEGAIQIIDGKARLVGENLCDGLGNCIGECPQNAITIEERPANEFDEQAVEIHNKQLHKKLPCGCPEVIMRKLTPAPPTAARETSDSNRPSQLSQFPIQLSLLPTAGEMWADADVVIAADCVGFVMPDFHEKLLADGAKTLAVGCPKLDKISKYVVKLTTIFANNSIRSITAVHMEVPCCNGIVAAVQKAMEISGKKDLPLRDILVGINGKILDGNIFSENLHAK